MAYKGRVRPTIALTADDIAADAVGTSEIAAGAVDTSEIATDAVTANEIAAGAVAASEIAATFDISSKTVTLPAAAVTAHVTAFDDNNLRKDIGVLALHHAVSNNKAAFGLSNSWVDQLEDGTGQDVLTNAVYDTTNEFLSTVAPGSAGAITIVEEGSPTHTTSKAKFGTSSIQTTATSNYLKWFDADRFDMDASNYTIEFWHNRDSIVGWEALFVQRASGYPTSPATGGTYIDWLADGSGNWYSRNLNLAWIGDQTSASTNQVTASVDTWYHYAITREDTKMNSFFNGAAAGQQTGSTGVNQADMGYFALGWRQTGCFDDIRISNIARYSYGSYTPPGRLTTDANTLFLLQSINQTNGSSTFTDTGAGTANATGNYTTATQTANSAVTKVGIVLLYKNVSGTASLNAGNDFYAEVSANGGTNYSAVTLTSSGTFSTGINIAVANSVAVTSGTTIKARISWANQSSGSKETQLHGVALLY